MIVADASALFQVLGAAGASLAIAARLFGGDEQVYAPYLLDAEILSVLRRHVLVGKLSEPRAQVMLRDFLDLPLTRLPHEPLLTRVFSLKHNMSAYDAIYAALAESLGATLVTRDARLGRAAVGICRVEVF